MNSMRQRWGHVEAKIRTYSTKIRTHRYKSMINSYLHPNPIDQKIGNTLNKIEKQPAPFLLYAIFEEPLDLT